MLHWLNGLKGLKARHLLEWRLPLLVTSLVVGVLAVFLAITYHQVRSTMIESGGERARGAADQIANMTSQSLRQRSADMHRVVADPALSAAIRTPSPETRTAAENVLRSMSPGQQVTELWTASGVLVLSVATNPAAERAIGTGAPAVKSGLRMTVSKDTPVVAEHIEAVGAAADGGPLGFVTARRLVNGATSSDSLNRLIGGGAHLLLGGAEGPWTDLSRLVPIPPIDLARAGVQEYRTATGEARLGSLSPITGTPWYVWVDFPTSLVLAPLGSYLQRVGLIALGFIVISAFLSRLLTSRITRPLTALTQASEAMSAGDYGRRVATDRRDEIGRLGVAFNEMAHQVQDAQHRLEGRIEERERVLAALSESDARHRAIVDVALDCIISIDQHGLITEFNPAAERTFGYHRMEVIGRDLADLIIPPPYREAHRRGIARYLATNEGTVLGRLIEVTAMRSNGEEFPVEIAIQAVVLNDQPVFTAYLRDLTTRRKAERMRIRSVELEAENRRVREASRLKSEFLANMSHELRTPLNAIIGFSAILEDGRVKSNDPNYQEFVGYISSAGRHLLRLINDVLDLSKVEAGKVEFQPEPLILPLVIDDVLSLVKTISASKRITVQVSVDPEIESVVLDPARLKQVLYNYVSNALKFTPDGGRVAVRATALSSEFFRLEVSDTGVGIAEADLGRLFVEFQQIDRHTRGEGGTGLGLALTRRLVEAQGGSVGVRSRTGEGSVFHAILPRYHAVSLAEVRPLPAPLPPNQPAILVIDDDSRDRDEVIRVLTAAGYAVEAVHTGADAIRRCQERSFDALTLDLLLPDQSGLDVLREIRAVARKPDVPVIVITVIAEPEVLAGHVIADILPKPVDTEALLSSLRRSGVQPRHTSRVLVVDDDEASSRLLAVTLERLGYTVEVQHDPRAALSSAMTSPPAAVIVDVLVSTAAGFAFVDDLRTDYANQSTPILVWTAKDLTAAEASHLRQSVRRVLPKSHSGIDALLDELRVAIAPVVERV